MKPTPIKPGDRVRCGDTNDVGVVLSVAKDGKPVVRFDNGAVGTCSAVQKP